KLYKNLMNDAAFQKQFLTLLQNPEITEQNLKLMKSQQFREHLEETIQETIDTPLFQAKIEKILLKAADKKKEKGNKGSGGDKKGKGGEGSKTEDESS